MSQAEQLSILLRGLGFKMVSAESCTGGMIAAAMTDIAGSSEIFDRGFVTYSNQSKIDLLGVLPSTLDTFGAVSEQTAMEMATGALRQANADVAVSVTGIAGPGGGTPEKPVGLVYMAVALKGHDTVQYKHIFQGDRANIRLQARDAALTHIVEMIDNHHG